MEYTEQFTKTVFKPPTVNEKAVILKPSLKAFLLSWSFLSNLSWSLVLGKCNLKNVFVFLPCQASLAGLVAHWYGFSANDSATGSTILPFSHLQVNFLICVLLCRNVSCNISYNYEFGNNVHFTFLLLSHFTFLDSRFVLSGPFESFSLIDPNICISLELQHHLKISDCKIKAISFSLRRVSCLASFKS